MLHLKWHGINASITLGCCVMPCQLSLVAVVSHLKWHKCISNCRALCDALLVVAGRCCVTFKIKAQMQQSCDVSWLYLITRDVTACASAYSVCTALPLVSVTYTSCEPSVLCTIRFLSKPEAPAIGHYCHVLSLAEACVWFRAVWSVNDTILFHDFY